MYRPLAMSKESPFQLLSHYEAAGELQLSERFQWKVSTEIN